MSGEELKSKIEAFFQKIVHKVENKSESEPMQVEFDEIMDELHHLNLLTDEELDYFSKDIEALKDENHKLKEEKELGKSQLYELQNSLNSKIKSETGILQERLQILQESYDKEKIKSTSLSSNLTLLESQLSDLQSTHSNLTSKYNGLLDELEINNKNVKKNFTLEKQVKELTEERSKLKKQLEEKEDVDALKSRISKLEGELNDKKEMISGLNEKVVSSEVELNKLKSENFNKFNRINTLENDLKIRNYKIEELKKEKDETESLVKQLKASLEESEMVSKSVKGSSDQKVRDLKNEIDKLLKLNDKLRSEAKELSDRLKNSEVVKSMAHLHKETLSKKDFSVLETMSRRVEESELLNQDLREQIWAQSKEIEDLHSKKSELEDLLNIYLQEDNNLISSRTENMRYFNSFSISDEVLSEMKDLKQGSTAFLLKTILSLKKDNINLKKQVTDITVECNKILRGCQ